jgi:hypothetical protein
MAHWDDAARKIREGLDIFEGIDNKVGLAMIYEIIGAAWSWVGEQENGVRMFGASEDLRRRLGASAPPQLVNTDPYRKTSQQKLGSDRFNALRAEGAAMSDAEVIALARTFQPVPDAPKMPPPEPWGKEAERRAAAPNAS